MKNTYTRDCLAILLYPHNLRFNNQTMLGTGIFVSQEPTLVIYACVNYVTLALKWYRASSASLVILSVISSQKAEKYSCEVKQNLAKHFEKRTLITFSHFCGTQVGAQFILLPQAFTDIGFEFSSQKESGICRPILSRHPTRRLRTPTPHLPSHWKN